MTDMYMTQEESKKKYLVPVVILMLCAVSLTGAAYAYSTTVTDVQEVNAKYDDQFDFDITAPGHLYFDVDKDKVTKKTTYTFNADDSKHVVKVVLKNNSNIETVTVDASINDDDLGCDVINAGNGVYFIDITGALVLEKAPGQYTVTVTVNGIAKDTPVSGQ